MRIGITISPAAGHLHPATALGRRLQSRGHEVICFGPPDAAKRVISAGLCFEEVYSEQLPLGSFALKLAKLRKLSGQDALTYTTEWILEGCQVELEELPTLLQRIKVDGLVVDRICPGAGAVALATEIPFVHISATPLIDLSGITPLWSFPWPYEDGEVARKRNRKAVEGYLKRTGMLRETMLKYLKNRNVHVDTSDVTTMKTNSQ